VDLNRTALTAVRIGALALAGIAATAGVSWAASHGVPTTGTTPTVTRVAPPAPLVVPDVRKLAFVFAKGELEDAGFAWTVAGSVHGYAANTVVSQTPAPGTKVVDTGAPLVTVTLRRAAGYPQTGEAADSSPYPSTALQLAATGTR
jgi:beta-lactam-binding protein with PASTA domain